MAYDDTETATAFAQSWNRLPQGSAYTRAQFLEWMTPLDPESFRGREVLELGFGNGSLLYHMASVRRAFAESSTATTGRGAAEQPVRPRGFVAKRPGGRRYRQDDVIE